MTDDEKNEITDQDLSPLFGETITDDDRKNIIRLSKSIIKMFDSTTIEMLEKVSEAIENDPPENTIATAGDFAYNPLILSEVVKGVLDYRVKREERKKFDESHPYEKREIITQPTHFSGCSKISEEIYNDFLDQGVFDLIVANKGKKNQTKILSSLQYEGKDLSITGRNEFTFFDKIVHDAVCSLCAAGNRIITPSQVARNMNGLETRKRISSETVNLVDKSMQKSRFMNLKIDFTDQAKLYDKKIDKTILEGCLLNANIRTIKSGGSEVKAYEILAEPILYSYNKEFKQIIQIDRRLLAVPRLDLTEESTSIKGYLINRVKVMKKNPKLTRMILYDTLLTKTNIKAVTNHKRTLIREKIKAVLTHLVEEKEIEGFAEYKTGAKYTKVKISIGK